MWSAWTTSVADSSRGHRPSSHHPRKQVKYHCQVQPPHGSPDGGRIGHPFGIGTVSTEIALEQIGSHLCALLAFCGHRAMTGTLLEEPQVPSIKRATRGLRTVHPLGLELCMDTRAAIHPTIALEHGLHLFCQLGIFSARLSGRALPPG